MSAQQQGQKGNNVEDKKKSGPLGIALAKVAQDEAEVKALKETSEPSSGCLNAE